MTATAETYKANRPWRAKFKLARKSTRAKAWSSEPMTKAEKREVLTNARNLLSTNYGGGDWVQFVNEVEHFCMYGALEAVCGFNPMGSEYDRNMSACSLTSTLYDAIPDDSERKKTTQQEIKNWESKPEREDDPGFEAYRLTNINSLKVACLQGLNDDEGKDEVLAVFDAALDSLS